MYYWAIDKWYSKKAIPASHENVVFRPSNYSLIKGKSEC